MKSSLDERLAEVTAHAEVLAGRRVAAAMKSEQIHRLRIPMPELRKAARRGYGFSAEPREEVLATWDYIWRHSAYDEVMHQALYSYQHRALYRGEVRCICDWIERCRSWWHSDDLSKIYADVVETRPHWIMPALRRWNRSTNAWKRRQSVVSLIEYARKRSRFLPFTELIGFVEPLLGDDDYYVCKGVGWTIREIYNAYPDEALSFIEQHATDIPAAGWTAATEKLDTHLKSKLKALRQVARSAR